MKILHVEVMKECSTLDDKKNNIIKETTFGDKVRIK